MASRGAARVTTNLVGGLGNQLFLMANLLAVSRRCSIPAVLPRARWSSSNEEPRPTYWASMFERLGDLGVSMLDEEETDIRVDDSVVTVPERRPVTPIVLDASRPCLYSMVGFFQSDGYFSDCPAVQEIVPPRLRQLAQTHLRANYASPFAAHAEDTHFVGLHVRRGDYTRLTGVFEQLDASYYTGAVRQLLGGLLCARRQERVPVQILVFCEESAEGEQMCTAIREQCCDVSASLVHPLNEKASPLQTSVAQPREVIELLMLSLCDDVVMANSTFSWWGAYLNQRPMHRVIAPSRWFVKDPYPRSNHLYCDGWMLL